MVPKVLILTVYMMYIISLARSSFKIRELFYLVGFLPVYFYTLLHPFLVDGMEFMPLMIVSVYSAFGISYSFFHLYCIVLRLQ